MELSQMTIVEPTPKPTIEEIFEDTDHFPRNTPLTEEEPILINLLEEEEIGMLRMYVDEEDNEEVWIQTLLERLDGIEDDKTWIRAKASISQEFAHKAEVNGPTKVILPKSYAKYRDIFEKKPSEQLPLWKP